ncbi:MAG: hypothetical protein SFW36_24195 [Leptolyngbyaceae cyanobacterium bins.59]|nr:hypothetical protein [Leptolyngbyaceae cyanobacterium bins.59]
MTSNPYPQNPAEFDPLLGGTVRRVGINREGYPYLVIDKDTTTFYLFIQSDAEGNSAGYLHITERSRVNP